jgi:hypothetical protein
MTAKVGNCSHLICWILGGVVGLCLCSCGSAMPGSTAESNPAVQTTTAQEISRAAQTVQLIPARVIAAQAIALATEIARPTNPPGPTNTLSPIDADLSIPANTTDLTNTPFSVQTYTSIPTNTPRATATHASIPTATPDDMVLNPANQHLYLFIENATTWYLARNTCASLGGHLVTIESASENFFVYQLAGNFIWLGATDEIQEGTWVWVTGEAWDFINWGIGEPNNCCNAEYCGPDCIGEDYLSLELDGTWNDQSDHDLNFVCEWEPGSP